VDNFLWNTILFDYIYLFRLVFKTSTLFTLKNVMSVFMMVTPIISSVFVGQICYEVHVVHSMFRGGYFDFFNLKNNKSLPISKISLCTFGMK